MSFNVSGIVILVIFEFSKAFSPNDITVFPSIVDGTCNAPVSSDAFTQTKSSISFESLILYSQFAVIPLICVEADSSAAYTYSVTHSIPNNIINTKIIFFIIITSPFFLLCFYIL